MMVVRRNERPRLQAVHEPVQSLELSVTHVLAPVEPNSRKRAVAREQLAQLALDEVHVHALVVPVGGLVEVEQRVVHEQLETRPPARSG